MEFLVEGIHLTATRQFALSIRNYPYSQLQEAQWKDMLMTHAFTQETVNLRYQLISSETEQKVVLFIDNDVLYEGDWQLFCIVDVGEDRSAVPLVARTHEMVRGSFAEQLGYLCSYVLGADDGGHLTIKISRTPRDFVTASLERILFGNNQIEFCGQISNTPTEHSLITDIIFRHERVQTVYRYPVAPHPCKPGPFAERVQLLDMDWLNTDGSWEVWLGYTIDGAKGMSPLGLAKNFINRHETMTAYNSLGALKKVQLDPEMEGSVNVFVADDPLQCEVTDIQYVRDKFYINGRLDITDIDFQLKNVFLKNAMTGEILACENEIRTKAGHFLFTTSYNWQNYSLSLEETSFSLYFQVVIAGREFDIQVCSNADDVADKSKIFVYPNLELNIRGFPLRVMPYYNTVNKLYVLLSNAGQATCERVEVQKASLLVEVRFDIGAEFQAREFELIVTHVETKNETALQPSAVYQRESGMVTQYSVTRAFVQSLEVQRGKFDVFLRFRVNSFQLQSRVLAGKRELLKTFKTFRKAAVRLHGLVHYSLMFEARTKKIVLEVRSLLARERRTQLVRFIFAWVASGLLRPFIKRPVWLIGENLGEVAQDNGFAFFKYCIESQKPENFFYVSVKDNKNAGNLQPYRNRVIRYDSFTHLIYYFLAQYFIVSHGIRDVIPSITHQRANATKIIYLQHGILAMKKIGITSKSYSGTIEKFVVSSSFERQLMLDGMYFEPRQLIVTGLARFDELVDLSATVAPRQILVIPTWRDWLVGSRDEFLNSAFYEAYRGLLEDKDLSLLLEENNLVLKFFPHIEMQRKYRDDFPISNPRIELVEVGKVEVKDLLQSSSLMITDYSSVAFDFNYMRKPVLFFQFDIERYLENRGAYVDLQRDLIGDVAYNLGDLIALIRDYAQTGFQYKNSYLVKSRRYYDYRDKNNAARIYEEIKQGQVVDVKAEDDDS